MGTAHDKEILSHIFNPLLPLSRSEFLQEEESQEAEVDTSEASDENTQLSQELELRGVSAAEKEDYDLALDLLRQAISASPQRASPYNNRAQVHRLKQDIQQAKMDLNNAINLSGGKGKAASQAFVQRGLISLKEKRESEAKADFEAAAKLGNQFAKAQLIQMNPYAALCNKMLRDVMGKIQRGESEYYENDNCNHEK